MEQHVGDICDAALPETQKWYQLTQSIVSGIEAVAIILFICIHRNSKYLHLTGHNKSFGLIDDHYNITSMDRRSCILLPIYYQFLMILSLHCIYSMIYMALLNVGIGNDFGALSNPFNDNKYISYAATATYVYTTEEIANLILFGVYKYTTSTIHHITTFWFLQPSSGHSAFKVAFITASLIGIADGVSTLFAVIHVKYRWVWLVFHVLICAVYIVIFFYMIMISANVNIKLLRWRFFYFYIIFFIVLYVLYIAGDAFVIISDGALDGCCNELTAIMLQCCVPIVLVLLLFDDSAYWMQFSRQLMSQEDVDFDFDRVMDHLQMHNIPVINKSDIEFITDGFAAFGSYSAVKKAKLLKNELVAIKSLYSFNDENYKYAIKFMREALLSWRLKHPNIVEFKGVFANNPNLCLVYEYMVHGSLFEYLTRHRIQYEDHAIAGSISLSTRLQFALDAARGIECLHGNNIMHRDINCRNLLVTELDHTLTVKLCDFGTAKQITSHDSLYAMYSMTAGIGTVAYMAPEVLRHMNFTKKLKQSSAKHKIEYGYEVDVFAFGGVLFEIMASKELYRDLKTSKEVQAFVMSGNRETIPKSVIEILNVPTTYIQLMDRCWQQHASQRPPFDKIILQLQSIIKMNK